MIGYRRASIGIEWFRTASWSSLGVMSGPSISVPAAGESGTFLFMAHQSNSAGRFERGRPHAGFGRSVRLNQLPESSRNTASIPYGRSAGSCRKVTPFFFRSS